MPINFETFYVRTVADIRARSTGDFYDLIRACGMLRQMFLDGGSSLYDLANKKHKVKLYFDIAVSELPSMKNAYEFHDILNGKKRKIARRDEFLNLPMVIYNTTYYTVKDFILYAANVNGGVHSGEPKKEHQNIHKLHELVKPTNYEIKALKIICLISIKALSPLESLLKTHADMGKY